MVSTQVSLHAVCPMGHVQTPPMQVPPPPHAMPQPPQWSLLVIVLTQAPMHAV
jgi:hypothetical protein